MRILLAAPMLLLALSGCVVDETDPDAVIDAVSEGMASVTESARGNQTAGALAFEDVGANATGLDVAFVIVLAGNGTAPTWTIAFGDNQSANGTFVRAARVNQTLAPQGNGTLLLANHTHSYAQPGTYAVNVTIRDGAQTLTRALNVTVADAAPTGPAMEPIAISGSCTTGVSDGSHTFDVTPGQARIYAAIDVGGGGIDLDWSILDPSGAEKDSAASFTVAGEDPLEVEAPEAGTWTIEVVCFLGAAASYDIDVVFTSDA